MSACSSLTLLASGALAFSVLACSGADQDETGPEIADSELGVTRQALSAVPDFLFVRSALSPNAANSYSEELYSHNSTGGGLPTVQRFDTGHYGSNLPMLEPSGSWQVTAYGTGSARCGGAGDPGGTEQAHCVSAGPLGFSWLYGAVGVSVDTRFVASYVEPRTASGTWGMARQGGTQDPYLMSYGPAFSGTGSVERSKPSPDRYSVNFAPGWAWLQWAATGNKGAVMVTAFTPFGSSNPPGTYCKPVSFSAGTAIIACFRADGSAWSGSISFNVSYTINMSPLGTPSYHYVFGDQPTTASYTVAASMQNGARANGSAPGSASIRRTQRGAYEVTIPNISSVKSVAHVTAVGTDNTYCKIAGTFALGSSTQANVYCYAPVTGAGVDSQFSLVYSTVN